jgi:DNA-binding FadR family transcriptional regulator
MSQRRNTLTAHTKLVDAIEAGDDEKARKLAAKHLATTQTYLVAGGLEQRIVALSQKALAGHG